MTHFLNARNNTVDNSPDRSTAEVMERGYARGRHTPVTLLLLARHEEATRLIFLGLHQHYLECAAAGRLEVWKAAAHSAVDLLGSVPEAIIIERETVHELKSNTGK